MARASLVEKLAPRLRELDKGGYARTYRSGGRSYDSSLRQAVGEILCSIGESFRQDVPIPGTGVTADFEVNGRFILVERALGPAENRSLAKTGRKCILITTKQQLSDDFDAGIGVVQIGPTRTGDAQTIFLDDPSFNFDYAHILPKTQKCSVMHGHTSSALVEIVGNPVDGMVVDFGVAKDVIREAIRGLDHKLFINRKYVTGEDADSISLKFKTAHGDFSITAPKQTTVLLEGEATVENMAKQVLARIAPKMPSNVAAVGVYVYEGLNKGTHLLAQVHSREVGKQRNRR